MVKQLTGKRDDSPLHSAARSGNMGLVMEIVISSEAEDLRELLSKQNQAGETAFYVAAEYGYLDLVKEMLTYYDIGCASIKARNGYDAFHIAARKGDLEMLKILTEAMPQLSVTSDQSNTTSLYTAAAQGHVEVVNFLLEENSSLATITRKNGKTALHSSARNGHIDVVKSLLGKEPRIIHWIDKKGQTALHMASKGQSAEVVEQLISLNSSLAAITDTEGNNPLHIATRKGRKQIVLALLKHMGQYANNINKSMETAFDIAEKNGYSDIATILQEHGIQSAKLMTQLPKTSTARILKQTVSDTKHEVQDQLQHSRQTQKKVRCMAKRVNKMHEGGLNNAINSTTIVSVLIATVAFAAIFTLPAQYADEPKNIPSGFSLGEANIAPKLPFKIFLIFDSLALFISLAVVVVQTSVVVVERKAKKELMAIINKLMWLACVFISIAFLAMCYIVVGDKARWLAIGITVLGSVVMITTLGTLCYLVIIHRLEAANLRSLRRSARNSKSMSFSASVMSDSVFLDDDEHKKLYAI